MQGYQEEIIDSIKGRIPKQVPKEWYSYKSLKIKKEDGEETKRNKEYNLKIAALKKPYFFIYNYDYLMSKYKKYIENCNNNCLIRFGLTVKELENKQEKTQDELAFIKYYYFRMPVSIAPSVMNRIAWRLEEKYEDIKLQINYDDFDTEIIKSGIKYKKSLYEQIDVIYKDYKKAVDRYMKENSDLKKDEKKEKRKTFLDEFRERVYEVCNNEKILCDIMIDLCYKQGNKQFVWDVCGDTIIENLLVKNNYIINYPVECDNGDVEWNGCNFKLIEQSVLKEEYINI
jgi:hypothetical protein